MKRLLASGALFLCSLLTFAQFSGSGTGTEDDPYLIYNENQLSQVSNFLDQEGVVFKLMKDLDLTSWIAENNPTQGWLPIGVESSPFKGKFYGNNHKITGLTINRSINNVGFFGYVTNATINNLTIEGTTVIGTTNVGVFVGYISGSAITNCHVKMEGGNGVRGTSIRTGGFVGYSSNTNYQTFSVIATVRSSGDLGGFAGKVETGTFSDGSFSGSVYIQGNNSYTGGLIGVANALTLTNIIVEGRIDGKNYTGGIVGRNVTGFFTNCKYEGTLSGAQYVGGIVGALESTTSTFTSCFSKGNITATGDYCGGIIGVSQGACIEEMESCSHFGDISGLSYVGGLVGAFLNTVAPPVLHSYRSINGDDYSTVDWYNETINTGNSVVKVISNCTAIGNLYGNKNIGGLIGSESTANGYTSNATITNNDTYRHKYYFYRGDREFWDYNTLSCPIYNEDFTKVGTAGSFTYNTYTRNTISLCLTNSYYSGNIQGTSNVGGLYGFKSGGSIMNNYVYANILGTSNVGGIVGYISDETQDNSYNVTTIKSNVANNNLISATSSAVGRIYGTSSVYSGHLIIGALGSAEGNRSLTHTRVILNGVVQEVSDNLRQGTSTGPSLLRLKATYVSMGWDFDNNWNILETECYPYKKYQAAPPVITSNPVSLATSISGQSLDGGTVYLYYKDRDAVSTTCTGNNWTFDTEALQSGALVQIYADVDGLTPSYFTTTNVGYPGSGTEEDPYRIYTAEDLQGASNQGYYKLMNDIDLTSWIDENSPTEGWPAIGRNSGEATYIDGDGHKVSGLWMNTTQNYNGLFSNFSAGQIKNLTVEVAAGKKVIGGDYTGILIGRNANGRIVNCSVKGGVEGTVHVGGVVGYVENSIVNAVSFDGDVTSTANDSYVGGIAGQMETCTVSGCRSTSTISASGNNSRVGGLTGYSQYGTITRTVVNTTLEATGTGNYVGGLVGYSETPITLSLSTGSASATGNDSYSGGLVGYAKSSISNSYSTANATGTEYTAGLVGYTFSTIDKCYAKGNVYGVMYGGGLVGELDGENASLTNSVACNNILSLSAQSSWGSRVIGGFKNGAAEPNQTNYALSTMQVSLNNVPQTKTDDSVEGIAKTEAQLMASNTYLGIDWDLSEVWGIDEGQMYPFLLWEIDINPVADVSFDKTNLLIAAGNTETITPSVLPLGATNKRLDWTSSNDNVATVDDGVVTAVAVGTATITATTIDGSNLSATCNVTVTANKDAAIAELQSIVASAQALYDNSTEGENIGDYAAGSRAQLLTVINSVNAQISSTMSDEALTQCTNDINNAITTFQNGRVTAGDDTDVSNIDNVIYIERVEASPGGQLTLSVRMKNAVVAHGFGFDLYLPEGVTVATDEDGFPLASLSMQRTTEKKTAFNADFKPDGTLNIQAYPKNEYGISGNNGEVALITINIAGTVEAGDYPIIIRNIAIADENSVSYRVDYVKSTLAISAYTLGDANSDGFIDVGDLTAISHYILERPDATFNAKAADANNDTHIDVGDLTAVSHLILWGSIERPSAARSVVKEMTPTMPKDYDNVTDISDLDNVIYVEPFTVAANSTYTMSVKMKNAVVAEGFGFDLVLPEGITVATDGDGFPLATLSTARTTANKTNNFNADFKQDGTLNVQAWSSNGNSISGNDGEVAQIVLNIAADVNPDTYPIYIRNIAISDVNAISHRPDEVETAVTVEANDGRILIDENSETVPDMAENINVNVKRTIKANEWSTICLPFAMTEEQIQTAFGSDVTVELADADSYETITDELDDEIITGINIKFSNVSPLAIQANHPYIIKVSKNVTSFAVDGVTVNPATAESGRRKKIGTSSYFIGNYVKDKEIPEFALFLSGNKFWYSTGATKMKAYRAYFKLRDVLTEVEDAAETRISFSFNDGEVTGIKAVNSQIGTGNYYNLVGRQVKAPKKGVYVKDGKKVIIK